MKAITKTAWLGACALVGLPHAVLAQELPAARLEESAPEATAAQHSGEPLSIEEAVEFGRARSFRIARALRNQESSDLRQQTARAEYLPRADLNLGSSQSGRAYSFSSPDFDYRDDPRADSWTGASVYVSMPIDISGVIGRHVEQAELQQTMAGNDVLQAVLDTSFEIRVAYAEALSARRLVEIDENVVERLEALIRLAPDSAAPFLQIELANARQALNASRTTADRSYATLARALRIPPETPLVLTSRLSDRRPVFDRTNLLETALANRPDVRQMDLAVEQVMLTAEQIDDYRDPVVNVSAFYYSSFYGEYFYEPQDQRSESSGVVIGLNIPLGQWDNGNLRRQRHQATLQIEQAEADRVELRERIALELRQAITTLDLAERSVGDLPDEAAAYGALRRAERDLVGASPEQLSALTAQASNARSAWREAQVSVAEAHTTYHIALFNLMHATGLEPETLSYAPVPTDDNDTPTAERADTQTPMLAGGEAKALTATSQALVSAAPEAQLRPVNANDAPATDLARRATQRSDIADFGPSHERSSSATRRGPLSRLWSSMFGRRTRTIIWE